MPRIDLKAFGGLMPAIAPKLLPQAGAQTATNCLLQSGRLEPLKAASVDSSVTGTPIALYKWWYGSTPSAKWLTWTARANVAKSPVFSDAYSRIYYTGDGAPKVKAYDSTEQTFDIAIPTPAAALTFAAVNRFVVGAKSIRYRFTGDTSWRATVSPSVTQLGDWQWQLNTTVTIPWADWPNNTSIEWSATVVINGTTYEDAGVCTVGSESVTVSASQASAHFTQITDTNTIWNCQIVLTLTPLFEQTETAYAYYVYTYVTSWGEEGPPSPVSALCERKPGHYVNLSNIAAYGGAARTITKKRIYRTVTGSKAADFKFVAEIANATTTYTDNVLDADTGEVLNPSTNPDAALAGMVSVPGGFLAAFKGRDVYFSEPWLPYSWPSKYMLSVEYDIVALAVSGNDLIILTKGDTFIASGTHPDTMSLAKIPGSQSCSSWASVCSLGQTVFFASPDGLIAQTGISQVNLTKRHYTRAQWQALTPTAMVGGATDGRVIMFGSAACIILNLNGEGAELTAAAYGATSAYAEPLDDALYFTTGGSIYKWQGASTVLTMTWRSKEFAFSAMQSWYAARVVAASYPSAPTPLVTLKLYANGTLVKTIYPTSEEPFVLQVLNPQRTWSVELSAAVNLDQVILASSMAEMTEGG